MSDDAEEQPHPYHEIHPEKPPWHYEDRRRSVKDAAKTSVWTLLLGVVPVFVFGYNIHSDLLDRLSRIESTLASISAEYRVHDAEANRYKDRIRDLEKIQLELQHRDPHPDPWTGTEGRENRSRIDKLERKLDGVKP